MASPLRRILIVDDSPEDREHYRRSLAREEEHGYDFVEAESGADGLALFGNTPPDCVLLDYNLPDMNGLEFLQEIRRSIKYAPVAIVMLTGQGDERAAVSAMIRSGRGRLTTAYSIRSNSF